MKKNHLLTGLLLLLLSTSLHAQCPAENKAVRPGESVTYDLYFNWKFIWVKCGQAFLNYRNHTYRGQKVLRCDLLSTTSHRVDRFFTMRDTLISYTTPQLVPLYFRKGALEGKRYTVDEVWYTYPEGRSHVRQRFRNHEGVVSNHDYESAECNYDMLSLLSLARSFDPSNYRVGQRINYPMATGKKVEMQTLIYRGKEDCKANDDNTYRCLVFSLLDYDDPSHKKELLRFFVTDDVRHLPVRIDFFLRFGTAKAFLKSVK